MDKVCLHRHSLLLAVSSIGCTLVSLIGNCIGARACTIDGTQQRHYPSQKIVDSAADQANMASLYERALDIEPALYERALDIEPALAPAHGAPEAMSFGLKTTEPTASLGGHQEDLYRRTLTVLITLQAMLTPGDIPLAIVNGIRDARNKIGQIRRYQHSPAEADQPEAD